MRKGQISFLLLLLNGTYPVVTSRKSHPSPPTKPFLPRNLATTTDSTPTSLPPPSSPSLFTTSPLTKIRSGSLPIPHPSRSESLGTVTFILLDIAFRRLFRHYQIAFPSQLGGCGILLGVLLVMNGVRPGLGDWVFESLTPGAGYLAKWLPVFFVPGLVGIPLAPSVGNGLEVFKVLAVVVIGFYFSCFTSTFAVLTLRKYQGLVSTSPSLIPTDQAVSKSTTKPFSPELVTFLLRGVTVSFAISTAASRSNHQYANLVRTIFMTFTTFAAYVCGARLPAGFTQVVHPLITSTLGIFAASRILGGLTGASFWDVLATYKSGSMGLGDVGAGDVLLFLLGPSVVSFAIAIYSRKKVVADNFLVILVGVFVSAAGGLYGTAGFVRLIQLGGAGDAARTLRLSMLPRMVTTPLAIAITNILGGDISLACAAVVLTGIFGGTYGARILTKAGVTDPVSRGIGIGASAQGLGVASMGGEREAFPFAAISMVLTAVMATVLVSVPVVRESVTKVAFGV